MVRRTQSRGLGGSRVYKWPSGAGKTEIPVYSSHLTQWRQQRERGALDGMRARTRGPPAHPVDPRVKQLEAENRRLQRKLQRAETIITLQKKVAEILGIPLTPLDNDEPD